MKYLMALDAGTGSIRAVIFNECGEQISAAQIEWSHKADPRFPGSMDFDYTENWKSCKKCIISALADAKINAEDLLAISTSCMREGIVLYDKFGKEIWSCANIDARSTRTAVELVQSDPNLQKQVYLRTGQTYALSAISRLLFIKQHQPDIYAQTAHLGMFNDWMSYKLSGKLIIEPTNGSTLGLINLQTRKWDDMILNKFGLPSAILPEIKEPGSIIGTIKKDLAEELKLSPQTAIVVGAGDAQLGCLGVGASSVNDAVILGGSFWQYEFNTDKAVLDPNARVRMNCYIKPDLWQYEAIAFQPGLIIKWFKNAFVLPLEKLGQKKDMNIYAYLDQGAGEIPAGSYNMFAIFSDIMNFIDWRHAACSVINFKPDAEKFNIFTFYRSLLENACMVSKGHIEEISELTGYQPKSLIFANGSSQSDLCCQILADVTGLEVRRPIVREASALGAALIAGYGVGLYPDLQETCRKLIKFDRTFYPAAAANKVYESAFKQWKLIYKKELELSDAGITDYMWCAPGADRTDSDN